MSEQTEAPGPGGGPTERIRGWLRGRRAWIEFQEMNREGWRRAWRRRSIQRRILDSPPLATAATGAVELRVLTWRRDWINMLWALKSFYHRSGADYPLYIHDGGLLPAQARELSRHFPAATIVERAAADDRVSRELRRRGHDRSLAYRTINPSTQKLFDFYLFSTTDHVVSVDSDIVFFQNPRELLVPPEGLPRNRYNRDCAYWYSMGLDELEAEFGLRPPPYINSGLSVVRRETIDFSRIEEWLGHPTLFADRWVTEQTLHALCGAAAGVELLPDSYLVSTEPGIEESTVCKHYPGYFRPLLYEEGMAHLLAGGFLDELRGGRAPAGRSPAGAPVLG